MTLDTALLGKAHFAGHGLSARSPERWYWPHMIIELSAPGASEVRRLWLRVLAGKMSYSPPTPTD